MCKTTPNTHKLKLIVLTIISFSAILIYFLLSDPIKQNPSFHNFADNQTILSIPNFWNVVSNIPFILFGIFGIFKICSVYQSKSYFIDKQRLRSFFVFFSGVFLTGLGSVYYHLHPTNQTLVWDRLPMTISFMAFFTIILSEFIAMKLAKLLIPLVSFGIFSIIYWQVSLSFGYEDLRIYMLVQFLPLIITPIIIILFKNNHKHYFVAVIIVYVIAKLLEHFDIPIYNSSELIGGHPIKHIAASIGPLLLIILLYKKYPVTA